MENTTEYYWENNLMVFTEAYHLRRGYCCKSGCRHCPYGFINDVPRKRVTMSWSGGKDSAYALHKVISSNAFEVITLHTVFNADTKRVGLHGISETLIDKQAEVIGIPIKKIYLPVAQDTTAYENTMIPFYKQCAADGVEGVVFGDIFLEDLKDYRIRLLASSKIFAAFPLWGFNTKNLVQDFITDGFKSIICAANASMFEEQQVGKIIDQNFLSTLPSSIDPCGENGEYHSFVFDGPIFNKPISLKLGTILKKEYSYKKMGTRGNIEKLESAFWFQDLILQA